MPTTVIDDFKAVTADLTHAASCSDSGCTLSLSSAPQPYVLLQVDDPHNPPPEVGRGSRCDFLFVGGDAGGGPWIVPIELTTGRSKSGPQIVAQLNGGLAVADARLRTGIEFRLLPILAHDPDKGINRPAADYLRKRSNYIAFRGALREVQLISCGSDLGSALKD